MNFDYLSSRISVKDKYNSEYELGYIFLDKQMDRLKEYDMDCFFIPSDKYRSDASEMYSESLYMYGANEKNKLESTSEMFAKLCFPNGDTHCIAWEYYFGEDSEGHNMYADAEKEYLEYDIDEDCEIYYLETEGYKNIDN